MHERMYARASGPRVGRSRFCTQRGRPLETAWTRGIQTAPNSTCYKSSCFATCRHCQAVAACTR
eukprot:5866256-Pyramimonas_sp.AAC.1